jgi:hypothetical protein
MFIVMSFGAPFLLQAETKKHDRSRVPLLKKSKETAEAAV